MREVVSEVQLNVVKMGPNQYDFVVNFGMAIVARLNHVQFRQFVEWGQKRLDSDISDLMPESYHFPRPIFKEGDSDAN